MVIDMAVLGAITLAGGALSTGNHIVTNRRLRKLEKENKIRTVEVSVLEVGLISTVGCSIIKERQMKKKMNQFKQDVNDRLIEYENELAALENELKVSEMVRKRVIELEGKLFETEKKNRRFNTLIIRFCIEFVLPAAIR